MSILPLTACFDLALGFFLVPIAIKDVIYTSSAGQDSQGPPVMRNPMPQAAVDPTDRKQLEIIFGGSVSDGSVGIWTKELLYVDDMYASGTTRRQSFYIDSAGVAYRITKIADWRAQTGFLVYLGELHVSQDLI